MTGRRWRKEEQEEERLGAGGNWHYEGRDEPSFPECWCTEESDECQRRIDREDAWKEPDADNMRATTDPSFPEIRGQRSGGQRKRVKRMK